MKNAHNVDAARLSLLLNELRLPAIKTLWPQFAEQADKELDRFGGHQQRHLAALHPGRHQGLSDRCSAVAQLPRRQPVGLVGAV